MNELKAVPCLKALIELFDREWHHFSFPAFGYWRNRGWDGAGSGFELNYYVRGENTVIQDKTKMTLRQGDLIYVPDNVRHSFCEDGSFELYYLMFRFDRPDLNAQMSERFRELGMDRNALCMPGLQAAFRALFTELRMDRQVSVMAKYYFLHIFMSIYKERIAGSGHLDRHEFIVRQVIDDIQELLDNGGKILLPEIAARHSLNERYLNRIFKGETGTTIGQYILSSRIEGAKRYLETTSMSVTEIAVAAGFYDGAHFTKAFKASENMTPKEYRKQHV